MKTTIYLVRHGEVHNPDRIIYGRIPGFQLSETGRKQAHALGKHLSAKKLSAIYASPLERTHETATHIHDHHRHLAIQHDERLIEVYSPLEGRPTAVIESENWNFYQPKYYGIGQEILDTIWNRMNKFLNEKIAQHSGEEIAVITHGDPIMITASQYLKKPLTVDSIRGDYVETAKGFHIEFDENGATSVNKLIFSY